MPTRSDILPLVRHWAKQCPDPMLLQAVREALQRFCMDSWYYQRTLRLGPRESSNDYVLAAGANAEIIAIKAVEYKGVPLDPVDPSIVDVDRAGSVRYFMFTPPGLLSIYGAPPASEDPAIDVRLVLQPTGEDVPEEIYRHFRQTIAYGALMRILEMPEEPWSNPGLAQLYASRFLNGTLDAKHQQLRGHSPGPLTVRPTRRFA